MNIREYSLEPIHRFKTFPFQFTYPPNPPTSLVTSIRKVGILSPLLCLYVDESPQILDGHRRLLVARELKIAHIPVAFLPSLSPYDLAFTWLHAQMASRSLNPFEIAGLVENGVRHFSLSSNEMQHLVTSELPALIPPHLFPELPSILQLPERLKIEAVARSYSPAFLVKISRVYPKKLIDSITHLLDVFSLSENQLAQLLEWIDEITGRDNLTPNELLKQDPIPFLLSHPKMPTAKKRDAFLKAIYEKRFPNRAHLNKALREIQDKISSVGDLRLVPPKELAGDRFELRIGFKSPETLRTSMKKVTRLESELHKVFDLL